MLLVLVIVITTMGILKIPIFRTDGKALLAEEIIKILFEVEESKICSQQPLSCLDTLSFVVDCDKMQHPDDIRMDDLGAWKNCGVHRSYFSVLFSSEKKVSLIEKMAKSPQVAQRSVYCLKRSYWKHKQDGTFTRQLYELTGEL